MDTRPVIVFAISTTERDYLRSLFPNGNSGVLSFEKEGICFDNLRSINPQAIIVRTDSRVVAWRFLFAVHALKTKTRLVMLSNELDASNFTLYGLNGPLEWRPWRSGERGFWQALSVTVSNKSCTQAPAIPKLFVGETEAVQRINAMLPSLQQANDPVLITGEHGTGKELLSRLISGFDPNNPIFIKIDCAALQSEKASASFLRKGKADTHIMEKLDRFSVPNSRATILLDKIDRLDKDDQGEILFLLENQNSGSVEDLHPKVRFIATTDADMQHLVNCNDFRKELFYRLNVIPVHLPPLRERIEDIPLLTDYLSMCACDAMQKGFIFFKKKTMKHLQAHAWPGNIDELDSLVRRFITSGEEGGLCSLSHTQRPGLNSGGNSLYRGIEAETEPNFMEINNFLPVLGDMSLKHICDKFASKAEKSLMQKALEATKWNRRKAAALLNISYKSMLNKMKLYEIV